MKLILYGYHFTTCESVTFSYDKLEIFIGVVCLIRQVQSCVLQWKDLSANGIVEIINIWYKLMVGKQNDVERLRSTLL